MNVAYFIGATLGVDEPAPSAPVPSNYKDPVKIAEKQRQLDEEALEFSPTIVTYGKVASFAMVDAAGRNFMTAGDLPRIEGPHGEAAALVSKIWSALLMTPAGNLIFVGFDIHTVLRVAALEMLPYATGLDVSPLLYTNDPRVIDPYKLLVPAEDRKHVSRERLVAYLSNPEAASAAADDATDVERARTARRVYMQMLDRASEAFMMKHLA